MPPTRPGVGALTVGDRVCGVVVVMVGVCTSGARTVGVVGGLTVGVRTSGVLMVGVCTSGARTVGVVGGLTVGVRTSGVLTVGVCTSGARTVGVVGGSTVGVRTSGTRTVGDGTLTVGSFTVGVGTLTVGVSTVGVGAACCAWAADSAKPAAPNAASPQRLILCISPDFPWSRAHLATGPWGV